MTRFVKQRVKPSLPPSVHEFPDAAARVSKVKTSKFTVLSGLNTRLGTTLNYPRLIHTPHTPDPRLKQHLISPAQSQETQLNRQRRHRRGYRYKPPYST